MLGIALEQSIQPPIGPSPRHRPPRVASFYHSNRIGGPHRGRLAPRPAAYRLAASRGLLGWSVTGQNGT